MKPTLYILLALFPLTITAQTVQDGANADFFRNRLHSPDIMGFLQATGDNTVIEGHHQGQWGQANQLIFSVGGNSFRENKYYFDGFRTNSRLQSGNTFYVPNMELYGVGINVHNSSLYFAPDSSYWADGKCDYVQVTGNFGGLGGINESTVPIVHLFHGTGSESVYDSVTIYNRQHIRFAGTIDATYTMRGANGQPYYQHIYATAGSRKLPQYDENGLLTDNPLYNANYYKVQLDGQLPVRQNGLFQRVGYLMNISGKEDGLSEFYYNRAEQPQINDYSFSLYGKQEKLTAGVTWTMHSSHHDDIEFDRNLIDQDGESLEPWLPDGIHHEFSFNANYSNKIRPSLILNVDAYNSLIAFVPSTETWSNNLYYRQIGTSETVQLYRYDWTSSGFTAGLLENKVSLDYNRRLSDKTDFSANAGITLDGMIVKDNTRITPNFEAGFAFDCRPLKWLQIEFQFQHCRMGYDIEKVHYMSPDYLNGTIMGTNGKFSQTGGAHHSFKSGTWQPSYISLYIPIRLTYGNHELALIQTYKKFYHIWHTDFAGGAEANGSFDADGTYWLNAGDHEYEVGYLPHSLCGNGFIYNTPYYVSQQTRYTYRGQKALFSASWQSLQASGPCALGNGPVANNIGTLSETTANPNTHRTLRNPDGKYAGNGRYDQDKGYILRAYFSYNMFEWLQVGCAGNWTDGQPFVFYNTKLRTDADGNNNVAVTPRCSRGTNPTDGNFGCRESAIFNFDLHARVNWQMAGCNMSLYAQCYNIWDYGNVLNEYCFPEPYTEGRGPNMCLTIPRGLIVSLKICPNK